LRNARTDHEYRAALETTIEESDGLIRTFDALLMIARAEAGETGPGMTVLDVSEIASGVGELYEPLAEEKGLRLVVDAPSAALAAGHGECTNQALDNVVENAKK